jgi:hypothetical protein
VWGERDRKASGEADGFYLSICKELFFERRRAIYSRAV